MKDKEREKKERDKNQFLEMYAIFAHGIEQLKPLETLFENHIQLEWKLPHNNLKVWQNMQ